MPVIVTKSPPAPLPVPGETLMTIGSEQAEAVVSPGNVAGGVRPWPDGDVVGAHGTGMLSPPPPWVEQAVVDAREAAAVVLGDGPPSAAVELGDVALQAARVAMTTAAQASLAAHCRIRSRIIRPPDHEGFSTARVI